MKPQSSESIAKAGGGEKFNNSPSDNQPKVSDANKGTGSAKDYDYGEGTFKETSPSKTVESKAGGVNVNDAYKGDRNESKWANPDPPVVMRNGVYMHKHAGYPSTAKTIDQAEYHPVSQRHRGEGGKDITEYLHLKGGLGLDGMGGMRRKYDFQSFKEDVFRGGKAKGYTIAGAAVMTGLKAISNGIDSLFKISDAMLSGNPLSFSSTAIGLSIDTFADVAKDYIKLREKYRIPENAEESALMQTITGRAFKGQMEAYNQAYLHAMTSSDRYLDLAADMSIYLDDSHTLFQEYAGPNATMPSDRFGMADLLKKREAYLTGHKTELDNLGGYETLHDNALSDMGYGSLEGYVLGMEARQADYADALNDLVRDGRVYGFDSNGFIDKTTWRDASTMSDSELDKYKLALQVGNKTTSDQLITLAGKVKTAVKRDRAEATRVRAQKKEYDRRVKDIADARMRENIRTGGVAVRAVYKIGPDTDVDLAFNPTHLKSLVRGINEIQNIIDAQDSLRREASMRGITDVEDLREFGVYSDDEIDQARMKKDEWSDMAVDMRAKGIEARNAAIQRKVSQMGLVSGMLYNTKKVGKDGIPEVKNTLDQFRSKLKATVDTWDLNHSGDQVVDPADMTNALDKLAEDVANNIGDPSKKADIFTKLTTYGNNSALLQNAKEYINSESIANPSAKADYSQALNAILKSEVKSRLGALSNIYSAPNKSLAIDRNIYNASVAELNRQYDQLSKGCDDASAIGVAYDPTKADIILNRINALKKAAEDWSVSFTPADIKETDPNKFDFNPDDYRKALINTISNEYKNPDSDFNSNERTISDADLNALVANTDMLTGMPTYKMRELNRMFDRMGVDNILANEQIPANRLLALLGTYANTGPFSFNVGGKDDDSKLISALGRDVNAYDRYVAKKYGLDASGVPKYADIEKDDAIALALESHIDYMSRKLTLDNILRHGSISDMERKEYMQYSKDIDEQAKKDMVNLSYVKSRKDFGGGRVRGSSKDVMNNITNAKNLIMSNDADTSISRDHYRGAIKDSIDAMVGYKNSINNVANAVSTTHVSLIPDTDQGLSASTMGDFYNVSSPLTKTPMDIKNDIQDAYGVDIDNGIDQMATMMLKKIGVRSFESLKNMKGDSYAKIEKNLNDQMKYYEGMEMDNEPKEAITKSIILAKNMVKAMSYRQTLLSKVAEKAPMWIGDRFDTVPQMMDALETNFDSMFKTLKETSWTADSVKSSLKNYSDIEDMSDDAAIAMSANALGCTMLGVSPSFGQGGAAAVKTGSIHQKKMEEMGNFIRENFTDMATTRRELIDSYQDSISKGEPVFITASGAFGGYQTNDVNIRGRISMPIEMYAMLGQMLKSNNELVSEAARYAEGDKRSMMDLKRWNEANDLTTSKVKIKDLALAAIPQLDADGNLVKDDNGQVKCNHVIIPILYNTKGEPHYLKTSDMVNATTNYRGNVFENLLGMTQYKGKKGRIASGRASIPVPNTLSVKVSAGDPAIGFGDESFIKADMTAQENENLATYMLNGLRTISRAYSPDHIGVRIVNNLPYPFGMSGEISYYLVNDTKDAVQISTYGTRYISRMHGVIKCGNDLQTLGGMRVVVTLPWEQVKVVPPCLFFGLLDVHVPWMPDGFKDPRIMAETAKTVPSRESALNAVRIIRDFGGFYDSPSIEEDKIAKGIRNIIMRAYAEVGAYGKQVFDDARTMAQSLPKLTLDNYYTVTRAAYRLAEDIGVGTFDSREAWHMAKGIRSNALLALSANPFMLYRQKYASSRANVDAIAYIGHGFDSAERELHVKDMMMLVGLMASCEPDKLLPYVPMFYEDMTPEWDDAADYWYIMVHRRDEEPPMEAEMPEESVEEVGETP